MALRNDIESARDRFFADLAEAYDYYNHTKTAWQIVRQEVDHGLKFTVHNSLTGSNVDETELLILSRQYMARELASATLQQFVAVFESFLFEVVRLWLLAYPESLSSRQLSGKELFPLPDKAAIINALVEKELRDIFYDRPANWFDYLQKKKLLDITVPADADKEQFSEIKATRDVLVHGHGIANAHYIDKAGRAARVQSGQRLDVTEPYHQASWELICRLTREIGDGMAAKAP